MRSEGITDSTAPLALKKAGATVHLVDMRRSPQHPANAQALLKITKLAWQLRPDLLHGHSAIGGALARAVPLAVPKLYTPNGLMPNRAAMALERLLGGVTTRLVLVSEAERVQALDLALVHPSRAVVIPNGVELSLPAPERAIRAALGIGAEVRLVGTVMRLAEQKAPEDFVRMCQLVSRELPDVRFVVVGDGPLAANVDGLAVTLGNRFTRIRHLVGVSASLADLDVFVLLSRYEGGPYVPLRTARPLWGPR